jgi:hypothetical protein
VAKLTQLETDVATAKQKLNAARTQVTTLRGQVAKLPQLETDFATAKQNLDSARTQLNAANAQVAALNAQVAALTKPRGTLTWSGFIMGRRKIEIKDGAANYGAVGGALPGRPCTVVAPDPDHVQLKTLPSANNHWSQLAFEVSGAGNLQVQINWVGQ